MASLSMFLGDPMKEARETAQKAREDKEKSDLFLASALIYTTEGGTFVDCVKRAINLRDIVEAYYLEYTAKPDTEE